MPACSRRRRRSPRRRDRLLPSATVRRRRKSRHPQMTSTIPTRKMASSMKRWAACIVLVPALVAAAPARAQTAAGEALFASGRQAYRDGHFEAAAHDFGEAYKLDHLPGLLFNQALALRKLWLVEGRRDALERA